MLTQWFRTWLPAASLASRRTARARGTPVKRRSCLNAFRPTVEVLEARLAPAAHTWSGSAGDLWSNPANWSIGGAPQAGEADIQLVFLDNGPENGVNHPTYLATNDLGAVDVLSIRIEGNHTYTIGSTDPITVVGTPGISVLNSSAAHILNTSLATPGNGMSIGVTLNSTVTLNGTLQGTGAFNKTDQGTLVLNAASPNFSGAVNVTDGLLRVTNPQALGNTSGETFVSNVVAATLELTATASGGLEPLRIAGPGFNDTGALRTDATLTWNGLVDVNFPCTDIDVGANSTLMLAGGLAAHGGSFDKTGSGTLSITGTLNAGGEVAAGALNIGANVTVGSLLVDPGATLGLTGGITLSGGPITLAGTLLNVAGNNSFTGNIGLVIGAVVNAAAGTTLTLTGNLTDAGMTMTCAGAMITGPGNLTKAGPGAVTLGGLGTSTYSGATMVNAGILIVARASSLGTLASGTTVNAGAALSVQGGVNVNAEPLTLNGSGINQTGALLNVSGNNTWNGAITLGSASTVGSTTGTLSVPSNFDKAGFARTVTGAGNSTFGGAGVVSGVGALTKTGAGTLTLTANITLGFATTITCSAGTVIATGNIDNAGFLLTVAGAGNTTFGAAGVLGGAGGLTKTGAGTLTLAGTGVNSYSGVTTITQGIVKIQKVSALGAITAGTTVAGGAALHVELPGLGTSVAEPLTVNGTGVGGTGALRSLTNVPNWTGPIALGSASTIGNANPTFLIDGDVNLAGFTLTLTGSGFGLGGIVQGTGGITIDLQDNLQVVRLSGNSANTYSGTTRVNTGELQFSKAADVIAVAGNLFIGNGTGNGEVFLQAPNQISDTTPVSINRGLLELGGRSDRIGPLNMTGGKITSSIGTLLLNGDVIATSASDGTSAVIEGNLDLGGATRTFVLPHGGPAVVGLEISALVSGPAGVGLTVSGASVLRLTGDNTYTGITTVDGGRLQVDGDQPSSAVVVNALSTLSGTGRVGTVTVHSLGYLDPGTNAALAVNGNVAFSVDSSSLPTFVVRPTNTNSIGFVATGSVVLINPIKNPFFNERPRAKLEVALVPIAAALPPLGASIPIVVANGGIFGTFSGLPQGAIVGAEFPTGTILFQIAYTPNVIFLTRISGPAFHNRTVTSPINAGGVAIVTGNITTADPGDTFFLDVNWGDGSATETFTVKPTEPRTLGVTHRYLDAGAFHIDLLWSDQRRAQNTGSLTSVVVKSNTLVTGSGAGTAPQVRVFDSNTRVEKMSFMAFDPGFLGGVRVATGDVDGDSVSDIIAAAGPGGGPHVRVVSGSDGHELASFLAYDAGFSGGVFVAAGDVNGDGHADIITGAGAGGGPYVRVFSGLDFTELGGFFAYDAGFSGGVTVAAGDVNGDGHADIIMGAGAGGGPNVRIVNGSDLSELASFFAYDAGFTGGVFVAAGDVNGDGHADIIMGAGAGGSPNVRVVSGLDLAQLASFFAYDAAFDGGVRVASADANGDGHADIFTGAGAGGAHVRTFNGLSAAPIDEFFAADVSMTDGVFVGGR